MITTMVSMLEKLIEDYCTEGKVPDKPRNPERNCEWEEYSETKEYLEKVMTKSGALFSFSNSLFFRLTTSSRKLCSRGTMITAA